MDTKILLIDNDKDRRDSLQLFLKSSGYGTVDATHCEDTPSLHGIGEYELILVDITFPDKSGFRVLEYLKTINSSAKVIVITGTAGLESVMKVDSPDTRQYVSKPYDPHCLLKSIKHILTVGDSEDSRIQIIKAGDFIRSSPTGELDMLASESGLAEIETASADLQDYTVLIDLRDIHSSLSTADIFDLASKLTRYGKTFRRRTAVLVRPDNDLGQAEFFETVAQNRGFKVRAFTVFEEAALWLANTPPLPGKRQRRRAALHS
jgi:DNA-binding response OmpR family regulator